MSPTPTHIRSNEIATAVAGDTFSNRLIAPGGWFWGRIGGSDFDAVARQRYRNKPKCFFEAAGHLESRIRRDRLRVRELNGFFDLNSTTLENTFRQYVEILGDSFAQSDGLLYGGKPLIDHFNGNINRFSMSAAYASSLVTTKDHISYEFIEAIHPFFATMDKWLAGKRVLIVSPFSKSVEHQYANRDRLFRNFKYPEFELATYETPITYNNKSDVSNGAIVSRTSNWVDELELMKQDIRGLNFDVALLSCGSYAGPLGVEVSRLGRKAIYVGGVLNVLFNIFGQRYDNDFVRQIVNPAATIDAFETQAIMARSGGKSWANEALRAYLR
jgi:hypothetical protein